MYISGYHLVLHFGVPGIWGSGGSLGVWVARGPGSGVPGLQRSRNGPRSEVTTISPTSGPCNRY